jgi:hypothetical protein
MAKFIALVSHKGAIPADYVAAPIRIPRCSGCRRRTSDPGTTRSSARTCSRAPTSSSTSTPYGAASTRIVVSQGPESTGDLANRSATAVAERLGTTPVVFPSNHGGFLGGEYGQTGEPEAFAAKLREILGGAA